MARPFSLPASLLAEPEPFDDLFPGRRTVPVPVPVGGRPVVPLDEVVRRIRPTAPAADQTLPVLPALVGLFPNGLRRGSTVGVSGSGARSLAVALMVRAVATGSWVAVVGDPDLGLAAVAEQGLALERLVVVDQPDLAGWVAVVATLVGALDLVLVAPRHRIGVGDARRLAARCRERGSVLVHRGDGSWPARPDLSLAIERTTWMGPDGGYGRLRVRQARIVASGRGLPPAGRRVDLLLPGPDGVPAGP